MGAAVSVRVVAVLGGHVVAIDKANGIKTQLYNDSKDQQWEIERPNANKPEEFALKNLQDGKYLRAPNGNAYTPCTTGDKQMWAAEAGEAPGSFWLRNLEFKDAYLCNSHGYQTANNVVYMWPKQQNWVRALTWYVRDVNAKGFLSLPTGAPTDTPEGKKAVEDLKAKQAELDEKEKNLAEREKTAAEAEKQSQENEKQSQENEKQSQENEKKAKELAAKEKEIAEAEKRTKGVAEELEQRERELVAKEKSTEGRSSSGASDKTGANGSSQDQADLMQRRQELDEKQKQLDARAKELDQREASSNGNVGASSQANSTSDSSSESSPDAAALEKEIQTLKIDNERLRAMVANRQIGQKRTVRGNLMSAGPAVGHNIPRVQPGSRLPGGWDPHLMARFEAGKKAMSKAR